MRTALLLSLSLSLGLPATARANGVTAHAHISDLAVDELPPGELRDFLSDPEVRAALHSGSVFPDSGYAAEHAYGEITHWEPFTAAYLDWIVANHPPPWTSLEDRQRVAFLLGAMSHGMADQVYDSLFMHKIEQYDGELGDFDRRAEMWLVTEHDPGITPLTVTVPFAELPPILLAVSGEPSTEDDFSGGMARIRAALRAIPILAETEYEPAWYALPWGATHYYAPYLPGMGEGGSLPHLGWVVSRYWQVVWERLHGTDALERSLVASWPEEGAVNVEATAGRAEARAMLVFGHAIDSASFPGSFHLRAASGGEDIAAHARFQWSDVANAVLVIWDADLAYDTEHVVELTTDLRTMDGRNLPAPVSVSFRTRCAPDRLEDCPPLPEPWVAPSMPPPRPDAGMRDAGPPRDAGSDGGEPDVTSTGCGCRAGRASGSPLALCLIGALLVRRRRAAHPPSPKPASPKPASPKPASPAPASGG